MPILKSSLTNWARLGATQRLIELKTEEASILKTFPELKNGKTPREAKPSSTRKPMSAAARRAVAIRMKKFWAEKRKEQKK